MRSIKSCSLAVCCVLLADGISVVIDKYIHYVRDGREAVDLVCCMPIQPGMNSRCLTPCPVPRKPHPSVEKINLLDITAETCWERENPQPLISR